MRCSLLRSAVLAALGCASWAADCSRTSTGFIPLNAAYYTSRAGQQPGLYPNGSPTRPPEHEARGVHLAAQVQPLAAGGSPDPQTGRVVLLSIGMSNTTQEFSQFLQLLARDPDRNPRLTAVDGAVGGWSADRIVANPAGYWDEVDKRLNAAGAAAPQVQAVWLKEADAGPRGTFPADAELLRDHIEAILAMLPPRFPNLKLVYLSSRIYAGYATTALNPEPYAYNSGFSVKWVIERQINATPGAVLSPWLSWGPYLWADGTRRNLDGLTWACAEFGEDGTHPSVAGAQKVARMLLDFFKSDSTTRPWFLRPPAAVPAPVIQAVVSAASGSPTVGNNSIASLYGENLAGAPTAAASLPLPYTLGGVRVTVGGRLAPLYYVSPTQINVLLPVNPSNWNVVVEREDAPSAPVTAQHGFYAPSIFVSAGVAAARHAGGAAVDAANPARPGETIEVYGTGIGVRNPLIMAPEILPQALFSGTPGTVVWTGPSPAWPGLYQWNVTVPKDAATGPSATFELRYGMAASNPTILPVAN